jgi:very-short-patch-repair endonuclease
MAEVRSIMPARNIVIGQKVTSEKVQRAKELRKNMTGAEKLLWQSLRANRLNGWHFRRQQIIGGFIADFYCHAAALVIELNGGIHEARREQDKERAEFIRDYGIEVFCFKNEEVLNQLSQVLQKIDRLCKERTSTPPFQEGAGGR